MIVFRLSIVSYFGLCKKPKKVIVQNLVQYVPLTKMVRDVEHLQKLIVLKYSTRNIKNASCERNENAL